MHLGAYSTMFVPARDYINALRIRAKIQKSLDELFAKYDAVITPTFAMTSYPSDRPFREYTAGKGLVHLNLRLKISQSLHRGTPSARDPTSPTLMLTH